MTDQSLHFPKFYVTAPADCPYLKGKSERKVFTELKDKKLNYNKETILDFHDPFKPNPYAERLHQSLAEVGFRRSQDIAYRPSCENCNECKSVRIPVNDFILSKSQKRIISKNRDITSEVKQNVATYEQYDLLKSYISKRHEDGGMAEISADEYLDMVESSPIQTKVIEYRSQNGPLIAAALTDVMGNALSMVYSFFNINEEMNKRSLGTYIVLDHISRAQNSGLEYVYLGYWIKNSPKMSYKANYRPLEVLENDQWNTIRKTDRT